MQLINEDYNPYLEQKKTRCRERPVSRAYSTFTEYCNAVILVLRGFPDNARRRRRNTAAAAQDAALRDAARPPVAGVGGRGTDRRRDIRIAPLACEWGFGGRVRYGRDQSFRRLGERIQRCHQSVRRCDERIRTGAKIRR